MGYLEVSENMLLKSEKDYLILEDNISSFKDELKKEYNADIIYNDNTHEIFIIINNKKYQVREVHSIMTVRNSEVKIRCLDAENIINKQDYLEWTDIILHNPFIYINIRKQQAGD